MYKTRSPRRHSARRAVSPASFLESLEGRVLLSRATGVDVSQYQTTINWTQVASSVNYAYVRASYGSASADPYFVTNANASAGVSIPIGFYHYAYYDLANHTPALEANNFWNNIKGYIKANGKYLMPMLDIEEGSALGSGTGESSLSQWIEDWCTDITNDAAAIGLHVVPIVYTSSSPAGSWFDSTPPKSIPLWVADYTGTTTPQTSTPTAGTGVWQTWQMWQYGSTGSVSGISGNVDVDVLNGDTTTLKDYIVSSSTGTPSGKWAVNTLVQTTSSVKAYTTIADAANGTTNYTTVASGTVGTIISGPTYAGSHQQWKVTFKNGVTGYASEDSMQTSPAPAAVTLTSPANNAKLSAQPGTLTWTSSPSATSYGVYLNGILKTTTTATSYNLGTLADGTYTWEVTAINSSGSTPSSTYTFTLDTVPPTATLPTQSPTGGSGTFRFTVNYADATSGVNSATLGNGNITVTGPNSFSQAATLIGYNTSTGVATYNINAPGGIWTAAANGTYTVSQNASSVQDNSGNVRPAGPIGTFIANTFAYVSGRTLIIDYGNTSGSMSLSPSGANLLVQQGGNTDTFASTVSTITISGTAAGDTFTWNGPITQPVTLNLSGGNGTLNVNAGTISVTNDVTNASPGLTLNVASGAEVDFTTNEGLAALSIDGGKVALNPSALTVLNLSGNLSLVNGGTLDLGPGQMVVNSTAVPTSALLPYLQSAYDNGLWDGPGITSNAIAGHPNTAIGYVDGTGNNGAPVGSELLAYALQGDTSLKGSVGLDDYNILAANFNKPGSWAQGDSDYDGVITLADYNALAANLNKSLPAAAPAASPSTPVANVATVSIEQPPPHTATPTITPATTPKPHLSPWRHIARQRRAAVTPEERKRRQK